MSFYNSFIGLKGLPEEARSIMRNYSIIVLLINIIFSFTATFSVLFIIDAIGFKGAASIAAISLTVILFTDYPSGSLGDWIGQKTVIMISLFFFASAFLLMSIASNFNDFVIVGILMGLGEAQASGALQSWLDNRYKSIDSNLDLDRKNYGYSMTKIGALSTLVSGITFIVGGYVATILSRQIAFRIQALLIIFTTGLVLKLLTNPTKMTIIDESEIDPNTARTFLSYMKGGIAFMFSSKKALTFIIGFSLFQVIWTIWGALMLFPFYFGYMGNDSNTGLLRSSIFFAGVFIQIKLSNLTKKVENEHLSAFMLIQGLLLFLGGMTILYFIPLDNSFNLMGAILVFVLMGISVSMPMPFINAIAQRLMVDFVPSENRNAVYSLIPTIRSAVAIPILPIIGGLIETSSLMIGFGFLLVILLVANFFIWISLNLGDQEISVSLPVEGVGIAGN